MPLLYIEVIKACNLRCRMCGFPSAYPTRGAELTTDELRAIFDDAVRLHTEVVSLGGGEPFLRKDIFALIDAVAERSMAMHINTNGTKIDVSAASRLGSGVDGGRHLHLALSLDHVDTEPNDSIRGRGVHAAVSSANALLQAHAPNVRRSLNVVVGQHSVGSLERTVEWAARHAMIAIKFQPMHSNLAHRFDTDLNVTDMTVDQDHIDALGDELRRARQLALDLGLATSSAAFVDGIPAYWRGSSKLDCYAGYVYGNLDPYGFLQPCYDHSEPLNVRKIGLVAAWQSASMQRMRAKVRACSNACWNNGNAEPSLRLSARNVLTDPAQIVRDLQSHGR